MTALPASRIHLTDRGRIAPNMAADVVVFDPAKVQDTATYDEPFQYPVGIDAVIVNGVVALRDGAARRPTHWHGRCARPDRSTGTTAIPRLAALARNDAADQVDLKNAQPASCARSTAYTPVG